MKAGCGRQLPAESWHAQDLHLHNLASLTTGLTFSRSAFTMIVLDGIGEEVADDARKSLAMQVDRRRATETESPATKRQSAQPFTILKDTAETSVACEEFVKVCYNYAGEQALR